MNPVFELNHDKLAADPRFADLARRLSALSPIDSRASFNRYCREVCRLWNPIGETSDRFEKLLGELTIRTSWGGVVVTVHQPPRVEKFLVVCEGGYLSLEMHEQKDERLEIKEGAGLILHRVPNEMSLKVEVIKPGAEFHFEPGIEHCLIAPENLLVFERSIDPKGMDQDLIFIYQPDAS